MSIIADNESWGMIKNMEKRTFKKRESFCVDLGSTDFVKIVKGFDCYAERVEQPGDIKSALERAIESKKPAGLQAFLSHILGFYRLIPQYIR